MTFIQLITAIFADQRVIEGMPDSSLKYSPFRPASPFDIIVCSPKTKKRIARLQTLIARIQFEPNRPLSPNQLTDETVGGAGLNHETDLSLYVSIQERIKMIHFFIHEIVASESPDMRKFADSEFHVLQTGEVVRLNPAQRHFSLKEKMRLADAHDPTPVSGVISRLRRRGLITPSSNRKPRH